MTKDIAALFLIARNYRNHLVKKTLVKTLNTDTKYS